MSMLLMAQAMSVKVGNPLRKLVLIKLADNANDKGECWPSYQHIADQCEISRRSVMNHVDALIESGFLKKMTRKGPKGNSSNVYILTISGGEYSAPHGAGDSLGVVQEIHQGSAGDSPHGAGDSPGGSAGDSPRTSHSFEPVIEPVIEPVNSSSSHKNPNHPRAKPKAKSTRMTLDWLPPDETVNQLMAAYPGEEQTLNLALINFRTYWRDAGVARSDWGAKFVTSFSNFRLLEIDAESDRHFSKIQKLSADLAGSEYV